MKFVKLCTVAAFVLASQNAFAAKVDPANMSHVAKQLLQIALQDDKRIAYSGLDGKIGPNTIAAIKKWQKLEGKTKYDPLDSVVVCGLIRKGIKGHGSGTRLPNFCKK